MNTNPYAPSFWSPMGWNPSFNPGIWSGNSPSGNYGPTWPPPNFGGQSGFPFNYGWANPFNGFYPTNPWGVTASYPQSWHPNFVNPFNPFSNFNTPVGFAPWFNYGPSAQNAWGWTGQWGYAPQNGVVGTPSQSPVSTPNFTGFAGFGGSPFGWTYPAFGSSFDPTYSPAFPSTGGSFPFGYGVPSYSNGWNPSAFNPTIGAFSGSFPGYGSFNGYGYNPFNVPFGGTTPPYFGGIGPWTPWAHGPYGHATVPFGVPATNPTVAETMGRSNGSIGLNREAA